MSPDPPRREWPALSESRWLRFAIFTAFYLVQGFPLGLMQVAFPAWLLAQKVDVKSVALFSFATGLPWALKLVSGPFMDRFAFPAMGVRRPWVIAMQAMLALTSCLLFFIHDPQTEFGWLVIACTAMNTLAALQDVAVDGMAITVLRHDERGRANAFMVGGQMAGVALTGAVGVTLLNSHGIPAAGALTAVTVGLVGTLAVLFRERPGERMLPWSAGVPHPDAPRPVANTGHLLRDVFKLLVLPMSLVLILVESTYRALEGVAQVWWPDLAINTYGFTDAQYANWVSLANSGAVIAGLAMGVVVDRIGARRGIAIGLICNALLYGGLWCFAKSLADPRLAIGALFAGSFGSQWMFISTVSLFMNLCGLKVAASQFAAYMALSNLARSGGSGMYPTLKAQLGFEGIFLFMAGGYLLALVILAGFNLERHRKRLTELGET